MDTLVKKAYENWMHVIEYDSESLLGFKEGKSTGTSQIDVPINTQDYPNTFEHQVALPTISVPSEQPSMDSGRTFGAIYLLRFLSASREYMHVHVHTDTSSCIRAFN